MFDAGTKPNIRVIDDSRSALFVLFDRDVSGLLNKSCSDIIESNNVVVSIFSTLFNNTKLYYYIYFGYILNDTQINITILRYFYSYAILAG